MRPAVFLLLTALAACAVLGAPHDEYLTRQQACIADASTPELARACICQVRACEGGVE